MVVMCIFRLHSRGLTCNNVMWNEFTPEGNWAELIFAKTSGSVSKDRGKNWPIADRCVLCNDPRDTCGRYFDSSPLLVS